MIDCIILAEGDVCAYALCGDGMSVQSNLNYMWYKLHSSYNVIG